MLNEDKNLQKARDQFYREYNREDPWTSGIYQPHTITVLLIVGSIVTAFAFTRDESASFEINVKYGLGATCVAYLLFSTLQAKDGLFVRPHPVIWRFVTGLGVLYLCGLVFLLFQSVTDARALMAQIDPKLGVPLPERSYAENCEFYTPNDPVSKFRNLYDTVNDEFILAHFLGWFGKSLLLRDYWLCWVLSSFFEILEVTFQHMLPNFAECWWDHIILDILVCNWLGFILGIQFMKFFQVQHYSFITPNVEEYHWEVLKSWKRMLGVVMLILAVSVVELNAFFLKFVLWIPPPHPINVSRLLLWWGIGLPGVREYYQWVTDKNCKKFGPMSWLCVAIMLVEVLVCVKFGKGMFPTPHPPEIVYPWIGFVVLFFLWGVWYYGFHSKDATSTTEQAGFITKEQTPAASSTTSSTVTKRTNKAATKN